MCGRYYIDDEDDIIAMREIIDEINRRYSGTPEFAELKTGEIRPTNTVPVIVADERTSQARLMRWGYPKWDGKGVVINARAETVAEKSMFRKSLLERRAVIPTTGFYEWRHEGGKVKEKYMFRVPGESMLYLAGMYNTYKEPDGSTREHFAILTTAANNSMVDYHDRMPVLLRPDERMAWLEGGQMTMILERVPDALEATSCAPQLEQQTLL